MANLNRPAFIILFIVVLFILSSLFLIKSELENIIIVNNFTYWNTTSFAVSLKYINPLIIPISYNIKDLSTSLYVNISHSESIKIISLELIPQKNSIIPHDTSLKLINNMTNFTSYKFDIIARHYYEIFDKTYDYNLILNYTNSLNNNNSEHLIDTLKIPFKWTIISKDLPLLLYFLIILAGMVIGKFILLVSCTSKISILNIDRTEAVWIIFTFIIAVLAFASFKENVQLANSVFFNIITAFVFGFGSQKVLEVSRQFPTFQSIKSSPPSKVKNLASSIVGNNIKLTWTNNTESDLGYYNIYKSTNPNFLANDITLYDRSKKPSYIDSDPTVGTTYYYKVAAVNIQNEVGEQSDEVSIHR